MEDDIGRLHSEIEKCDNENPAFSIQGKYAKETDPHTRGKCFTYSRKCDKKEPKDAIVKHSLNNVQNGNDFLKYFPEEDSTKSGSSSVESLDLDFICTLTEGSSNLSPSASEFVAPEDSSVDESCKLPPNSNGNSSKYFAVPLPGERPKLNFLFEHGDNPLHVEHWCKVCGKGFESQAKLTTHVAIHSEKRGGINSHIALRYAKKVHPCGECGKVFSRRDVLVKHFEYHHAEKQPHLCKNCGKGFKSHELLSSHLADQGCKEQQHLCDVCGKAFRFSHNLRVHLAIHSEERRHVCNICGKGFKIRSSLTGHLLTHSEKCAYVCKVCKKAFKTRCNLRQHLIIHSEERPFVCELCGKTFKFQGNLKKHHRVHVEVKSGVYVEKGSGDCSS